MPVCHGHLFNIRSFIAFSVIYLSFQYHFFLSLRSILVRLLNTTDPMETNKKYLLFFFLLFVMTPAWSQTTDSLRAKAELFFRNDEYNMAIPLLRKLAGKHPGDTVIIKELGICYTRSGQVEQGIRTLRSLMHTAPDYAEAAYELANTWDIAGNPDSAVYWFRKYTKLKPEKPAGYIRLAVLFMDIPGKRDSSVFFARKALIVDPAGEKGYYVLAMAYMQNEKYNQAIDAASKGLSYDSTRYMLYYPWGLSLFFQHNYGLAYQVFSRGARYESQGSSMTGYRALSLIMSNTPPDTYTFDQSGQPVFQILNTGNMDLMDKRVKDPLDRYYYPSLIKKFHDDPHKMGLDEFFMLYYGFSTSSKYKPYHPMADSLDQFLAEGRYNDYIRHAQSILSKDPTNFPVYDNLSMVCKMTGDANKQYEYLFRYYGFKNAIMATGNGSDAPDAFIVTNVNHEYDILRNLGLQPSKQEMVTIRNHHFDVLTTKNGETSAKIWFNIDKPYKALNLLMKERQSRGRR